MVVVCRLSSGCRLSVRHECIVAKRLVVGLFAYKMLEMQFNKTFLKLEFARSG